MITYFILSFISFFIFTTIFYKLSYNLNLLDRPNYRKIHDGEIPLIGGIIIFFNILVFSFFFETSYYFNFILYTSSILIIFGVIDDSIELGVNFRLIAQLISCLIIVGSGLVINNIGAYSFLPKIETGFIAVIFTVVCVIGLTNAFNFIDGIDGLCGGLSLISILSIISFSYLNESLIFFLEKDFIILICFIIFLFLIINISHYFKIFLGDAGSMFLGFFVSWLLIMTSQNENIILPPVLTIWCVALPVFDIISVIIRRILKKKNPFRPDRTHIHHILLNLGLSSKKVFSLIITASIIINASGFIVYKYLGPLPSLLFFVILLILYIFSVIIIVSKNIKV